MKTTIITTEICTNCNSFIGHKEQAYIYKDEIVCGKCNNSLNTPEVIKPIKAEILVVERKSIFKKPTVTNRLKINQIECKACGGSMKKKVKARFGVFYLLIATAIGLLFCLTLVGLLIGVPIVLICLIFGSFKIKFWQCTSCGSTVKII